MGKKIIIFIKHRNVDPIIEANKDMYLFINFKVIHKLSKIVKIVSRNEKSYAKSIYMFLNIIKPKAIISCNWLSKAEKVFYLYSKKNDCEYIVVQHGAYYGGIVTAKDHRFMICSKFIVWGDYFKKTFDSYNPSNKENIIIFGNPVYNNIDRNRFEYPSSINKILIAFSFIQDSDLPLYEKIVDNISSMGFKCNVKYHNKQKSKFRKEEAKEIKGDISEVILDYDLLICDHSSVLLDSVFFKRYLIFADHSSIVTFYEKYLTNYFTYLSTSSQIFELDRLVDIEAQERMYVDTIYSGNNDFEAIIAK